MGIPGVEYFAHPYAMNPRKAKEFLYLGERMAAEDAERCGMINKVVSKESLFEETLEIGKKLSKMPRFGLALTKKAINQAEDRMGLRDTMDSVYGLHHVAHAHNSLTSEDHLAGQNPKSMAQSIKSK